MTIPEVGTHWELASVVWGKSVGSGALTTQRSPFGHVVQEAKLLDAAELSQLFPGVPSIDSVNFDDWRMALVVAMRRQRSEWLNALRSSNGFIVSDCDEIFDATVSFIEGFETPPSPMHRSLESGGRSISIQYVPWGTVAAVLPQNAFLSLALTVLLNAIATGNRVVLRAPTGSLRLAAMLGHALQTSGAPEKSFSVVACDAGAFVDAWSSASQPVLLHFMGGSERGSDLLNRAWASGKPCLIDGTGNTYLYVDRDQDPAIAAGVAWKGAIRYNGETCTSVNGMVVHPDIAAPLFDSLAELVRGTRYGIGELDDVGPLFSARQAVSMREIVVSSRGKSISSGADDGPLFAPTWVESPDMGSNLVTEGIFAPALWTTVGDFDAFGNMWTGNRYRLCAAVLSGDRPVLEDATRLPDASRIVLNGDPSVEDPREPWGAYPQCGWNPVGDWAHKYLRAVQVDSTLGS